MQLHCNQTWGQLQQDSFVYLSYNILQKVCFSLWEIAYLPMAWISMTRSDLRVFLSPAESPFLTKLTISFNWPELFSWNRVNEPFWMASVTSAVLLDEILG